MKENSDGALDEKKPEKNIVNIRFLVGLNNKYTQLTMLADRKAGIILGVFIIMLSLIFTHIASHGLQPVLIALLIFDLMMIILAVMSLMPRFVKDTTVPENLIFFNVVAEHSFESYSKKMEDLLLSEAEVYQSLIIDCYQTSFILKKKFRYLKYCYKVCLFTCLILPLILIYFFIMK